MFDPGCIIVVTEKPDVTFVTVKRNVGNIPGLGWLLITKEGNTILVTKPENSPYLSRVLFITDLHTLLILDNTVLQWKSGTQKEI